MSALFKATGVSKSYTIAANGEMSFTAANLNYSVPTGYGLVGLLQYTSGDSRVFVQSINPAQNDSSAVIVRLRNISNTSLTATFSMSVRFAKNKFFG